MDALFIAKKVIAVVLLPPNASLLLALAGLTLLSRKPRMGRMLVTAGVVSLLALCLPVIADALMRLTENDLKLDWERAAGAQAVVILAGGLRGSAPEYGGDTLNCLSLERARYGAKIAGRTGLPVLVSGGMRYNGEPEARIIGLVLGQEYGVKPRWLEVSARDTRENAILSAAILRAAGVQRVILVTHAFHMRRARNEFLDAGLEVVPATNVSNGNGIGWGDFIPDARALQDSYFALHEVVGEVARPILRRLTRDDL